MKPATGAAALAAPDEDRRMGTPEDQAESQEFGRDLADAIDGYAAVTGVSREEAARKLLAEAKQQGEKELADILDRILRRLVAGRN